MLRSTGIIQPLHATDEPTDESLMFGKGEIPVIIFGILFAMLFILQLAYRRPRSLNTETIRTLFNG